MPSDCDCRVEKLRQLDTFASPNNHLAALTGTQDSAVQASIKTDLSDEKVMCLPDAVYRACGIGNGSTDVGAWSLF